MSTAPTEAHAALVVKLRKFDCEYILTDKEAAQLLADSEARAVEAANTEIAELKRCIEELYKQAHETVQFSDSNEMSMDMEISAAFGILASHRDEAQAALTAERERVRALEEYFDAVHSGPVNYSAGNNARVRAAVEAIKSLNHGDTIATETYINEGPR